MEATTIEIGRNVEIVQAKEVCNEVLTDTSMPTLKDQEKSFSVIPVGIGYKCEFCNDGEMIAFQKIIKPNPFNQVLYRHRCTNCKRTIDLPERYPHVAYKRG